MDASYCKTMDKAPEVILCMPHMHYHVNVSMPYVILFRFENGDIYITHIINESLDVYNTQSYNN
jgi:hypothetical protein